MTELINSVSPSSDYRSMRRFPFSSFTFSCSALSSSALFSLLRICVLGDFPEERFFPFARFKPSTLLPASALAFASLPSVPTQEDTRNEFFLLYSPTLQVFFSAPFFRRLISTCSAFFSTSRCFPVTLCLGPFLLFSDLLSRAVLRTIPWKYYVFLSPPPIPLDCVIFALTGLVLASRVQRIFPPL